MREHSRDKGSFERFYRHLYWSAVETNYWYAPVHSVVIVVSVVVKKNVRLFADCLSQTGGI